MLIWAYTLPVRYSVMNSTHSRAISNRPCRASNKSTCPHHAPLSAMQVAINNNDPAAYVKARAEAEANLDHREGILNRKINPQAFLNMPKTIAPVTPPEEEEVIESFPYFDNEIMEYMDDLTWGTPEQKANLAASVAAEAIPSYLDQKHADYYADTWKKHGSASGGGGKLGGSTFTDEKLKSVDDVVRLRVSQTQRGMYSLHGDERESLIAKGADPEGFGRGKRYLIVDTPGKVGILNSSRMADTDTVHVVRTKRDAKSCSLVAVVKEQADTDYAVLVIGDHKVTKRPFVITTFPGPVTKPTDNADIDKLEGQTITVAEARSIIGSDFWVNTKTE